MEETPRTALRFGSVVVVAFPASSQRMGFNDEYGMALSQEVTDLAHGMELTEAAKDGVCKIVGSRRNS